MVFENAVDDINGIDVDQFSVILHVFDLHRRYGSIGIASAGALLSDRCGPAVLYGTVAVLGI